MNKYRIRKAIESDADRIMEILHPYLGTATLHLIPLPLKDLKKKLLEDNAKTGIWVFVLMDRIIGFGEVRKFSPKRGYQYTGETSVFLDGEYLNQGYGSIFKQFIIEQAKNMGYHSLIAKIFATNHASIQYNQKLGDKIIGILKEAGHVKGKWIDICIMQLLL